MAEVMAEMMVKMKDMKMVASLGKWMDSSKVVKLVE